MSSLSAARADNFYYPPDWTPDQVYHRKSPLGVLNFAVLNTDTTLVNAD